MGWAARWRRAQAVGSATRSACSPRSARPPLSGARHAAGTRRHAVSPARRRLRRDPSRVREGVEGPVPPAPLQCPARPRPSDPGSGRIRCALARRSGPHDSRRQGGQPGAQPSRDRVGGQISRACARHAARSTACARLRPAKLAQASGRRPRLRSAVVRGMVPRVANDEAGTAWTVTGSSGSDMARKRRLATAWSHRRRRDASPTISAATASTIRGEALPAHPDPPNAPPRTTRPPRRADRVRSERPPRRHTPRRSRALRPRRAACRR
jgi:hypothetical protein